MQHEDTFLEFLRGVPEEVRIDILETIFYDMVVRSYYYINSKSKDEKVSYPEDELLSKLGYDVNDRAFPILRDYILYIVEAIKEKGIRKAYKFTRNKNSYIYVELAHYDYDIGLNTLKKELNRIHSERKIDNIDLELYNDVFGEKYERDVYESSIVIAKYINNKNKKSSEQTKTTTDNKVLALA